MPYEVYGPFESSRDAAILTENLGLKGIKEKNITVFVNSKRGKEVDQMTDVRVEDDADHSDEKGILYKMKQMLNNVSDTEEDTTMYEEMLEFGLSKEQAQRYTKEVKAGKILVVASPEARMGQDPAPDDKNIIDSATHRNK